MSLALLACEGNQEAGEKRAVMARDTAPSLEETRA